MNVNYSQANELTQDVEIRAPRAVRVVRTVRTGLSATAMASTLRTFTSMTKSKESSFQIAEFFIDHPILAILVVALIALIGSICIFAIPTGWLPF
jgi:predicted Zn-dependent protease